MKRNRDRNLLVLRTPHTPVYYVTLQFSIKKNFNFTVARMGHGRVNYTIPDCTINKDHAYIPCGSCNVSSFTDVNVTFGCYNSYDICPKGKTFSGGVSSHRRVLLSQDEYLDDEAKEEVPGEEEGGGGVDVDMVLRRVLQASAGSVPTGTPVAAPVEIRAAADDDGGSSTESGVLTYGTLVKSLAAETGAVLSINTAELLGQAIATGRATPVLLFVCSITGAFLLSFVYMYRIDTWEKVEKKYVKKEREKLAVRLLAEDLRSGGKGDLGDMFVLRYQRLARRGDKVTSSDFAGVDALSEGADNPHDNHHQLQLQLRQHLFDGDGHSTDFMKDSQNDNNDAYSHIAVATSFIVNKFPGDLIYASKRGVLLRTIFAEHEYTGVFTDAPLASCHTLRVLELGSNILIALFISTLFFGVFYPTDDTCPNNITKSTCLAAPSKVQRGKTLCVWDKPTLTCSLNPPPEDATFTLVLALLTGIICLPFKAVLWFLREEIGTKDPWEKTGLDKEIMKSTEKNDLHEKQHEKQVDLRAAQFGLKWRREDNQSKLGWLIKAKTNTVTRDLGRKTGASDDLRYADDAAMWLYDELMSPAEEATMLLTDSYRRLQLTHLHDADEELDLHQYLSHYSSTVTEALHVKTATRAATTLAIEEFLGLYPDGTPVPLTLRQRLMFGDTRGKLEYKVIKSRCRAKEIVERVEDVEAYRVEARDVALVRAFILECLSPFKR